MPACRPAGAPGITAVAQMTRAPAARASANMAASAPGDFRAPLKAPRQSSQTSSNGKAAHSSLASSAKANHPSATQPLPECPKAAQARQHDAARPDVIDRFGLHRMEGEEHARDERRVLRQQAAQALPGR